MYLFFDLIKLLKKKDKMRLFFLFLLIILNVFCEMIGIGIIFPLLGFLMSENFTINYSHYLNFLENFFELTRTNLVIFFSIMLVFIFLIKNIITFILSFFKYKFTYELLNYFSIKLFKKYITNDYIYFTKNNSSVPIRNIENVAIFTEGINQFLFLLIELIFILSILFLLIYVSLQSTLVLIFLILFSFFVFKSFTKKKLIKLGDERQYFLKRKMQTIYESMQSIKEIKIFFSEIFFKNKYENDNAKYSHTARMFETYQSLPKIWLEMVGVTSLSIILVIMLYLGQSAEIVISTIAIFGVSAVRIIPSLNRLLSSFQFLNHYSSIIQITVKELNEDQALYNYKINKEIGTRNFNYSFKKSLEIKNLSFSYGEKKILDNINLYIKKKEVIGIIGKTGSGKSTLANILVGILKNISGEIIVDEKYYLKDIIGQSKSLFGYIPQSTFLLDDSIKNNVAFGEESIKFNSKLFWHSLKISKIDDFVKSLPNKENEIVGEKGVRISGGQIQRIGIARALYRNPEILILDEATSSLDLETEKLFIDAIAQIKNKITMIIITHRLSSLKICDKVYEIKDGNLIKIKKSI
jgi:ATP-binding cassette, subfamily B, bacterial PglK